MHLGSMTIRAEITDILLDSCEVLVIGEEADGQQTVIDARQLPWPIPAREWRPMWDATRRWLTEAVLVQ